MAVNELRLRPGLTFREWEQLGLRLARVANGSAWSLGDWLVYGERTYGQRYRDAIEATRLDYQTLRNYAWVARAFPVSRRRDTLSFGHHVEVAAMEQPEQELWLQRAETAGWSRNELRRRLGEYRRQLAPGAATVPVVLRVEVSPDREQRWRDAAAASRRELAEWMSATVDAAADAILLEHLGRVGPAPRRQRPGSRNSHHSG